MSNKQALKQYDIKKYRTPDGYTSDICVFTIIAEKNEAYKPPTMDLKIMLIKRAALDSEGNMNIEANRWAIPGGFVQDDETGFQAAKRELEEETNISGIHIKQFGVYDKPGRDPRGWIISNAHYAIVPDTYLTLRKAQDDAADIELFSIKDVMDLELAFDHQQIIADAIRVITNDLLQTTVAKNFLPEYFTYSELQAVLKTVTNDPAILSDQSFSRKIKSLPFIQEVQGKTTTRTSKRATKLYTFIEMDVLKPIYTARY